MAHNVKQIRYSEFVPNPYWRGVLEGITYLFNRGGRGTGKTKGTFKETIYKIVLKRNQSLLVIRRHESTHRSSTFAECLSILDEWNIPYKSTKNPLNIRLVNGSEIQFKGLDKPEKIKSIFTAKPIGAVIFEETTEIENWDKVDVVIQSIRSVSDIKFIFNYNPDNPNHWLREKEETLFTEFGHAAKLTVTTIRDNPFLDKDFVARQEARKVYDERQYNVSVLGMWQNLGKTVYTIDPEKNFISPSNEEREFFHTISIGIDLGDVEATTFVAYGFKDNYKTVIPIKEYVHANKDVSQDNQKGWDDYVTDLTIFLDQLERDYQYNLRTIYCEYSTAGNAFMIMARKMGVDIRKAPKEFPIKERVMFVEWMLRKGILRFRKTDTPELITQFRNAKRDLDSKNNDYYRIDANDIHLLDAGDYAVIKYIKYVGGREWQTR